MRFPLAIGLVAALLVGCTRPIVSGRVRPMDPLAQVYTASPDETLRAAKEALVLLGYSLEREDEASLVTRWQSTRATSHFTELFDQKDFGTVGSYYRIELRVREREGKTEVAVAAPVKSIAPHQRSTYREERKVLRRIRDLLRRDDFEMTNVGTE